MWTYKKTKSLLSSLSSLPHYRDPYLASLSYHKKKSREFAKTMPYLRGTKRARFAATTPTVNADRLDWLERKIANKKQEIQDRHSNNAITSTIGNLNQVNFSVTGDLIASSGFRNKIIGDKWGNQSLKVRCRGIGDITSLRIIIYAPRKVGTTFTPTLFTTEPDHTLYRVFSDRMFALDTASGDIVALAYAKLGGLLTHYDSSSTTLDQGEIRFTVLWKSASASTNLEVSYDHSFFNK